MALSVAGERLALGEERVMPLNKEGRDGFPWKVGAGHAGCGCLCRGGRRRVLGMQDVLPRAVCFAGRNSCRCAPSLRCRLISGRGQRQRHCPRPLPMQTHWAGLLLSTLGAQLGDTLLLQKRSVDGDGVIHVEASLERGPEVSSGSGGGAAIAAAARAAVCAAVALAPRPSATSLGSAWESGEEVQQQAEGGEAAEEGDEEVARLAAAKRRRLARRTPAASASEDGAGTASEGPACRYCGRR